MQKLRNGKKALAFIVAIAMTLLLPGQLSVAYADNALFGGDRYRSADGGMHPPDLALNQAATVLVAEDFSDTTVFTTGATIAPGTKSGIATVIANDFISTTSGTTAEDFCGPVTVLDHAVEGRIVEIDARTAKNVGSLSFDFTGEDVSGLIRVSLRASVTRSSGSPVLLRIDNNAGAQIFSMNSNSNTNVQVRNGSAWTSVLSGASAGGAFNDYVITIDLDAGTYAISVNGGAEGNYELRRDSAGAPSNNNGTIGKISILGDNSNTGILRVSEIRVEKLGALPPSAFTVNIASPNSTRIIMPERIYGALSTAEHIDYVKVSVKQEDTGLYLDAATKTWGVAEVKNDAVITDLTWSLDTTGVTYTYGSRFIIEVEASNGAPQMASGSFKMYHRGPLQNPSWDNIFGTVIPEIESNIALPEIPNRSVSILDFGGAGDCPANYPRNSTNTALYTDNRQAFADAIAYLASLGGGRLVVPAAGATGIYMVDGPIWLESHIELHIEKGAEIWFGYRPEKYPNVRVRWEGVICYNYSPLIYARGKTDIAITGEGTINGRTDSQWINMRSNQDPAKDILRAMGQQGTPIDERVFGYGSGSVRDKLRPTLITFYECENILIEDVTLKESPFWTVHPIFSNSITVRGISVQSTTLNDDGVDPDSCSNVIIENCTFNTRDDNVAIKAGRDNDAWELPVTENIIIRNNNFLRSNGSNNICMGSEMSGGIFGVYAYNNTIGTWGEAALYLKADTDRGGEIGDIFFKDITATGSTASPAAQHGIWFQLNYKGVSTGPHPSNLTNVYFDNIDIGYARDGIVFEGLSRQIISNVYFNDVVVRKIAGNGRPAVFDNTRNVNTKNTWVNGVSINQGNMPAGIFDPESGALLKDILIDGEPIAAFAAKTVLYDEPLTGWVTGIPNVPSSAVVVQQASESDNRAVITVTALDTSIVKTYTVNFSHYTEPVEPEAEEPEPEPEEPVVPPNPSTDDLEMIYQLRFRNDGTNQTPITRGTHIFDASGYIVDGKVPYTLVNPGGLALTYTLNANPGGNDAYFNTTPAGGNLRANGSNTFPNPTRYFSLPALNGPVMFVIEWTSTDSLGGTLEVYRGTDMADFKYGYLTQPDNAVPAVDWNHYTSSYVFESTGAGNYTIYSNRSARYHSITIYSLDNPWVDPTYTATAEPADHTFPAAAVGYSNAGMAQEFTITNTGNQNITGLTATLKRGAGSGFEISVPLSGTGIDVGDVATISIRPKHGLAARVAAYTDTLTIRWDNNTSGAITIPLSFTVTVPVQERIAAADIRANALSDNDKPVEYIVSTEHLKGAMNIRIRFEVDGNYLASQALEVLCDAFTAIDDESGTIRWTPLGDDIWQGDVLLMYLGDEEGFSAAAQTDIFKAVYDAKQLGNATMKLTQFLVTGLDEAGNGIFLDSEIRTSTATTLIKLPDPVYSIYDLNRDGIVDQRDLAMAQRYYQAKVGDASWSEAQACDFDGDGDVDMLDLLDLFLHFDAY